MCIGSPNGLWFRTSCIALSLYDVVKHGVVRVPTTIHKTQTLTMVSFTTWCSHLGLASAHLLNA